MPAFLDPDTIDVFALVDSDTAEAHTYTTYLFYWDCLARAVTARFGNDWCGPLISDLQARKPFKALSGRSLFKEDPTELRGLLLNAWNSEVNLYLVNDDDPRLQPASQWAPVLAYYATGRAALGWLVARDGTAPKQHRPMLRALGSQVSHSSLFPEPWNLYLGSGGPDGWGNFRKPPEACSNLASNVPPNDGIAKMLKTTREKRVDELVKQAKEKENRKRARPGESRRQDLALEPTTVFDFTWRSRTRSNYGDPSMFYVGSLGDQRRAALFVNSVRLFTAATMLMFEALIAQRAPTLLLDAAVHYISRDRTKISEILVADRLRALGFL